MANETKKHDEENEQYPEIEISGPVFALEPITYCAEYLGKQGFYVNIRVHGKPGGCVSTPGHPCPP